MTGFDLEVVRDTLLLLNPKSFDAFCYQLNTKRTDIVAGGG